MHRQAEAVRVPRGAAGQSAIRLVMSFVMWMVYGFMAHACRERPIGSRMLDGGSDTASPLRLPGSVPGAGSARTEVSPFADGAHG